MPIISCPLLLDFCHNELQKVFCLVLKCDFLVGNRISKSEGFSTFFLTQRKRNFYNVMFSKGDIRIYSLNTYVGLTDVKQWVKLYHFSYVILKVCDAMYCVSAIGACRVYLY